MALIKHPSDVSIMHDRTIERHQPKRDKEGIVMRKVIFAVVLAVFIFGLFSLFNTIFSGQVNAQVAERLGWCCVKSQVIHTTSSVCKQKGGVMMPYRTQEEASKHCGPPKCWCCAKNEVNESTAVECKQKGGVCYSTKEEAVKRCPPLCWCCTKAGKVVHMNQSECKKTGGKCYESQIMSCYAACWCCTRAGVSAGVSLDTIFPEDCNKTGYCISAIYSRPEAVKMCPWK